MTNSKVPTNNVSAKEARDEKTLAKAKGYNGKFVNKRIIISDDLLNSKQKNHLPIHLKDGNKGKLNYTNLSVYYHAKRRVPFYSAYNIDLDSGTTVKRMPFKEDPRIDVNSQMSKHFYDRKKGRNKEDFDIGHMAACNEMAWGENAQLQSLQTCFFPNTCPQVLGLNQGLWLDMESRLVAAHKEKSEGKICVFTGPILNANDPYYINEPTFQMPMRFFKVIVFEFKGELHCTGLLMSHVNLVKGLKLIAPTLIETPIDDFSYKLFYQVDMEFINKLSGIKFRWKDVKPIKVDGKHNTLKNIDAFETRAQAKKAKSRLGFTKSSDTNNPHGFILAS